MKKKIIFLGLQRPRRPYDNRPSRSNYRARLYTAAVAERVMRSLRRIMLFKIFISKHNIFLSPSFDVKIDRKRWRDWTSRHVRRVYDGYQNNNNNNVIIIGNGTQIIIIIVAVIRSFFFFFS